MSCLLLGRQISKIKIKRDFSAFIPYVILIVIGSVYVLWTVNYGEISGIPDTHAHTMLGVFFADFLREGAFLNNFDNIMDYIWNYYARYNNISLLHWPHFYHFIEGLFFIIFGISAVVGRSLTFLFFIIGVTYFYRLVLLMANRTTAFLAAILYISSPLILFHARTISLETPSVTLCLMATYYFYRYTAAARLKDGLLLTICTGLALLTKQTSIYLIGFFTLYSLYQYFFKNKLIFSLKLLFFYTILISIMVLPYYIIAFYHHSSVISKDTFKGFEQFLVINNYIYYIINLPKQINLTTIMLLVIAAIFHVTSRWSQVSDQEIFFLTWAAVCYVLFTAIGVKEPRYIIYWVPALSALAALPAPQWAASLATRLGQDSSPVLAGLLVGIISTAALTEALFVPRSYISGYQEVARYLLSQVSSKEKEIVFYDGDFNGYGAIVFAARQTDPQRRVFFFRSSKFLFAKAIFAHYALWEIRKKEEDIKEFFNKYGIKFILVNFLHAPGEEKIPVIRVLREMLMKDPDFRLVRKFPIVSRMDHGGNLLTQQGELLLYAYAKAPPVPDPLDLDIPMPSIGKTVTIRLR